MMPKKTPIKLEIFFSLSAYCNVSPTQYSAKKDWNGVWDHGRLITYPRRDRAAPGGLRRSKKGKLLGWNYGKLRGDRSTKSRMREEEKGSSGPASQVVSQIAALWLFEWTQQETAAQNTRVKNKNQQCLSFFFWSCRSFHTAAAPYVSTTYHFNTLCCISSPPPLPRPPPSLMAELLPGDTKAPFSHLKSILNSWEREQLSEMLNWTLDLSQTL